MMSFTKEQIGRALLEADIPLDALERFTIALTGGSLPYEFILNEDAVDTLRQTIGDDEAPSLRFQIGDGHSGRGVYVSLADYPGEGSTLLKELR